MPDQTIKDKGFSEAKNHHGNPDMLQSFFSQIKNGLILEPTYVARPDSLATKLKNEYDLIAKNISELQAKIDDVRKEEQEFRTQKSKYEEDARQYSLKNSTKKFNPASYYSILSISIILALVIFLIYSIFFMHLFSPPTTKIIPPISEFKILLSEYWLASFLAIIPLAMSFVTDLFYKNRKNGIKNIIALVALLVFTFFLDFIIAYATRTRIAQANELLGIATPDLLVDTNFWIVIFTGPIPVFVLSVLWHFTYKSSKSYIEEISKNPFSDTVLQYRDKEMNRKRKAEELAQEIKKLQAEKVKKDEEIRNNQYIPKDELDRSISEFYKGWREWITNFFNEVFEREKNITQKELLEQCKNVYDTFIKES